MGDGLVKKPGKHKWRIKLNPIDYLSFHHVKHGEEVPGELEPTWGLLLVACKLVKMISKLKLQHLR